MSKLDERKTMLIQTLGPVKGPKKFDEYLDAMVKIGQERNPEDHEFAKAVRKSLPRAPQYQGEAT